MVSDLLGLILQLLESQIPCELHISENCQGAPWVAIQEFCEFGELNPPRHFLGTVGIKQ